MEFSRRGPATAAADGNRFPEPPPRPHGEREPMMVMRDALLSQLHMARLRQEIIEAELAETERALALRAATASGHQTMPMPWHGLATADAGRSKQWPLSAEQRMADQNAEFHERKLLDSHGTRLMEFSRHGLASTGIAHGVHHSSDPPSQGEREPMLAARDALLLQLHMDRRIQEINKAELAKIEHVMVLHAATAGDHETTPMPWHGVVTADHGRSKPWLFSADQPVAQQNAEFVECKLPDSNKAFPPSKTPPTEKWELTGITIPVKKPKPPMKWNCSVCQVQTTSEQALQQHYAGQKHLSNVATLDPTTKASDQKAKMAVEPSLSVEEKKTSSIKWSCSTCQANGTSQSTLEAHLKGKRHQQNIAATCVEGNKYGMPKNVMAQEAKSHSINVPKHSEKQPSTWSCNICQVVCTCQTDFKNHLKGIRHREKVQSLLEQSKNKASDSESHKSKLNTKSAMKWSCNVCQVQATCEQNLHQHYAGQKHLSNVATLDSLTKGSGQKAKTAAEPSLGTQEKKTSTIKWSCSTCEKNGTCQSTLEAHLKGRRHQQNMAATNVEGDKNDVTKNVTTQEATLDPRIKAGHQKAKTAAVSSVGRDQKKTSSIKWICDTCQANGTSQSTLEAHLKGRRHQQNMAGTSVEGDKNGATKNLMT